MKLHIKLLVQILLIDDSDVEDVDASSTSSNASVRNVSHASTQVVKSQPFRWEILILIFYSLCAVQDHR